MKASKVEWMWESMFPLLASKATASRDLLELSKKDAFTQIGGGRSTRYELNLK